MQATLVRSIVSASVLFLLAAGAAAREAAPLFDAMPLKEWRVVGGAARFELLPPANGGVGPTLVGKGPIERNGFLASPREVRDFRLAQLVEEETAWRREIEARQHGLPELTPMMMVVVARSGGAP